MEPVLLEDLTSSEFVISTWIHFALTVENATLTTTMRVAVDDPFIFVRNSPDEQLLQPENGTTTLKPVNAPIVGNTTIGVTDSGALISDASSSLQ